MHTTHTKVEINLKLPHDQQTVFIVYSQENTKYGHFTMSHHCMVYIQ